MLFHRRLGLIHLQQSRFASNKWSLLEQMAGMVSQLSALETPDAAEYSSKPGGPKPNALKEHPQEEPIPPLPAPVRGYPTPWVTEHDVLSYIYPLYTRGWGQSLKLLQPSETETEKPQTKRFTMLLSARYRFQDFDSAISFFLKIAEVAKAENHHPSIHFENARPFTITVTTQTDSARRPTWVEEETTESLASRVSENQPEPVPPAPTKLPGITLRDVRLAVMLEEIYSAQFSSHIVALGRQIHPGNFRLSWFTMERIWKRQVLLPGRETGRRERRRMFVERLMKQKLQRKLKCYACGGDHRLSDCTKRKDIAPQHACHYCKEMHWTIDCPVRPPDTVQ